MKVKEAPEHDFLLCRGSKETFPISPRTFVFLLPGDKTVYSSLVCQRYAHIKEDSMKGATVCGGEQRVKNIYMSDSHKLTIEIVPSSQSTENPAEFLLQYQGNNTSNRNIKAKSAFASSQLQQSRISFKV